MNVAPRHLTAEAETLLSATLIHEVDSKPAGELMLVMVPFEGILVSYLRLLMVFLMLHWAFLLTSAVFFLSRKC